MTPAAERAAKFQYERTFGAGDWEKAPDERKAAWVRTMEPLLAMAYPPSRWQPTPTTPVIVAYDQLIQKFGASPVLVFDRVRISWKLMDPPSEHREPRFEVTIDYMNAEDVLVTQVVPSWVQPGCVVELRDLVGVMGVTMSGV